MQRFGQLTVQDQAAAVQAALNALATDSSLLDDPTVRPALDRLAQARARDAYYAEPGDRIIALATIRQG